jgi:hypothetical protein
VAPDVSSNGPFPVPSLELREHEHSHFAIAAIAIIASFGVLLVAEADIRSRSSGPDAYGLFWAGLLLIFVPVAWRVCRVRTERTERLVLIVIFGLALYLVKCLYSPTGFVFHDEYAHLRTTLNLVGSGRLFGFNPEIRVAADYPGISLVTAGVSKVTRLSLTSSGLVVVGAARLLLMTSLFLLFERVIGSPRAAAIACLVYAGNANFLYWDAQFAYESLALPLAVAALYLVLRRSDGDQAYTMPALIVAGMVIITHHLTSYALAGVLIAWAITAFVKWRSSQPGMYVPTVPALFMALGAGLWTAFAAPLTIGYLFPVFSRAVRQGVNLVVHQRTSRALFVNPGGLVQPGWEQAIALCSVLIVLVLVPIGLWVFHGRWQHPLAAVLAWSSLLYIFMLPLRFTSDGQEAANRSGEFLFIGIGMVFAMILTVDRGAAVDARHSRILSGHTTGHRRSLNLPGSWPLDSLAAPLVAFVVCSLMFVGGVAVSWSFAERQPAPLTHSAVPSVPTPDDIAAATWMLKEFGPHHRIATDITTGLAFDTFGQQNVLSGASNGAHIWRIFGPRRMTTSVYRELVASDVQFIVVQKQLVNGLPPVAGTPVYDSGEPVAIEQRPVPRASQAKFTAAAGLSMVYASSSISIYQVNTAAARSLETSA